MGVVYGIDAVWLVGVLARELTMFAAVGFLIGGIDELAIDLVWLIHRVRRGLSRHVRVDADTIAPADRPGRLAIFIPAWDEGEVIGPMLDATLRRFDGADIVIYVGV